MTAATDNLPSEASPASFSPSPPHARHLLALLALAGLLAACSPRQLLVQGVADALATQGQADEEDLALARDASPFYLKLSESLLKESPGNLKLAQSVASGFTQYAYAFVASEAEAIAQPGGDRPEFERLLGLALAASAGRPDMSNQVMRARAQWLLGMADDLF